MAGDETPTPVLWIQHPGMTTTFAYDYATMTPEVTHQLTQFHV
jgi:hypothetical protein